MIIKCTETDTIFGDLDISSHLYYDLATCCLVMVNILDGIVYKTLQYMTDQKHGATSYTVFHQEEHTSLSHRESFCSPKSWCLIRDTYGQIIEIRYIGSLPVYSLPIPVKGEFSCCFFLVRELCR